MPRDEAQADRGATGPDGAGDDGGAAPTAPGLASPTTVDGTRSAPVHHEALESAPLLGHEDLIERTIGRYRVVGRLGAGGMGVVYEAVDPSLDRRVALKVLRRPDRDGGAHLEARLAKEARALARLQHPNVLAVYDTGGSAHGAFVVMQLVDGESLERRLVRGPLPWREAVTIAIAAGRGLAAAHAAGIVHRDVKPSNILLEKDGTVRVGDFGLARSFDEGAAETSNPASGPPPPAVPSLALTVTGAVMGTPRYMAPEQHLGLRATAQADQFSLCVTLYEALWRTHPFAPPSRDMAVALAAMRADAVRPPPPEIKVPRSIERAIRRGLRFEPDARFPTVEALVEALAPRRSRARWAVAAAVVAAAVVASISFSISSSGGDAPAPTGALRPERTAVEIRRVTRLGNAARPEVSPDGRLLAYMRGDDVYVRTLDGPDGNDRKIASGVYSPRWAPGSDALSVWAPYEQSGKVLSPTGEVLRKAAAGHTGWSSPGEMWSFVPYGKEILFRDDDNQVVRRCRIPGDYDWIEAAEVSARSGKVLALTRTRSSLVALWTFERDCSRMRALLVEHNLTVSPRNAPRWNVDGDAVVMPEPGRSDTVNLVTVPLAWPWMRRSLVEGLDLRWFSIGRDGSLYYGSTDAAAQVWRLSPHGGPTRLTGDARPRWGIALTPDAAAVIYGEQDERASRFVLHPLDGSPRSTLFEYPFEDGYVFSAALSPDGARLAVVEFSRRRGVYGRVIDRLGASPASPSQVEVEEVDDVTWRGDLLLLHRFSHRDFVVMRPDGTRTTLVADPSVGWLFHPAVSPDGRTVAVQWNRRPEESLWTIGVDDHVERSLAPHLRPLGWSRDGAWIYATDDEYRRYVRVPARGGAPEPWLDARSLGHVTAAVATPDGDAILLVGNEDSDLFVVPGVAR